MSSLQQEVEDLCSQSREVVEARRRREASFLGERRNWRGRQDTRMEPCLPFLLATKACLKIRFMASGDKTQEPLLDHG